jgi:predicted nucleotidyltransferase
LATLRLRDRDAIVTEEGLIFRIFGYTHPKDAYVCDVEYAPATIFKSNNPKAFRNNEQNVFYKFYEDEGWRFLERNFPQYLILHEILQKKVVGVNNQHIMTVRKPETELERLMLSSHEDKLLRALQNVLKLSAECSGLSTGDFGVFGSMLHGFHHPDFSDIDLVVYGRNKVANLCKTLQELYEDRSSPLRNEFETCASIRSKHWQFQNLSPQEYVWHQRRKMIYALFNDGESGRIIKTEFEPVKNWEEISNEYDSGMRVLPRGWVRMAVRITEDSDAPFIPSIYSVEPLEVLHGAREAVEAKRIVSYLEEFRMQVRKGENVHVEGNLEEVTTSNGSFYQIALTYCPRYYEQVLKTLNAQ